MNKYAKIINHETKQCEVGTGTNSVFYEAIGMEEMDVEQSDDGNWYLTGYLPNKKEKSYIEKRILEYPCVNEQLDMIFWDKINGTNNWSETISKIKTKYPKDS